MVGHDELRENLKKEIAEFKQEYEKKEPMQVYNDWYHIAFYEAYCAMLASDYIDNRCDDDLLGWLSEKEKPLGFLYAEWLSCDGELSLDWDDMLDWLESEYEREKNRSLDDIIDKAEIFKKDVRSSTEGRSAER